jgi:hypothetical protein
MKPKSIAIVGAADRHRPGLDRLSTNEEPKLNTNGGGLSYMHSGMYGMYALQESVRQMRGTAPAQIPGVRISVCHGVGGMFAASGAIMSKRGDPYTARPRGSPRINSSWRGRYEDAGCISGTERVRVLVF